MSEPAAVAVPTEEAIPSARRFHLLLGRGIDRQPFQDLVADKGTIQVTAGWLGTAESATRVSPIEADARLARWSKKTGRLAVRITRTDQERFWIAVHYQGQRSFAMIHSEAAHFMAILGPKRDVPIIIDTPFGSDPRLIDRVGRGEPAAEAVEHVLAERAEELAAALSQDDVHVEGYLLKRILTEPSEAALVGILEAIRATPLLQCISDLRSRVGKFGYGAELNVIVGKAALIGLLLPAAVATTIFAMLATQLADAGMSPFFSFLLASIVGVLGMWATREGTRRVLGARAPRRMLQWAGPTSHAIRHPVPLPPARDKWGGLFFLLRDIGFLANLERPRGPAAAYVDTWGVGPDALVEALNHSVRTGIEPPALYGLARSLVDMRDQLITDHLAGTPVDGAEVSRQVQLLVGSTVRPDPTAT